MNKHSTTCAGAASRISGANIDGSTFDSPGLTTAMRVCIVRMSSAGFAANREPIVRQRADALSPTLQSGPTSELTGRHRAFRSPQPPTLRFRPSVRVDARRLQVDMTRNSGASLASASRTRSGKLDQLKKSGSITDQEYSRLRAKLVSRATVKLSPVSDGGVDSCAPVKTAGGKLMATECGYYGPLEQKTQFA